jgi:hypothetical protein
VSDWLVMATGPSMSADIAARAQGRNVVAVSDSYHLLPWAKAMVSSDGAWWRVHPQALAFPGRKFTVARTAPEGVERLQLPSGINSGLLGLHVAALLGATRIFLFGVDLAGSHYFGEHPEPLQNTQPHRFEVMRKDFARWAGAPVFNCSPQSTLQCFPFADPEAVLC